MNIFKWIKYASKLRKLKNNRGLLYRKFGKELYDRAMRLDVATILKMIEYLKGLDNGTN